MRLKVNVNYPQPLPYQFTDQFADRFADKFTDQFTDRFADQFEPQILNPIPITICDWINTYFNLLNDDVLYVTLQQENILGVKIMVKSNLALINTDPNSEKLIEMYPFLSHLINSDQIIGISCQNSKIYYLTPPKYFVIDGFWKLSIDSFVQNLEENRILHNIISEKLNTKNILGIGGFSGYWIKKLNLESTKISGLALTNSSSIDQDLELNQVPHKLVNYSKVDLTKYDQYKTIIINIGIKGLNANLISGINHLNNCQEIYYIGCKPEKNIEDIKQLTNFKLVDTIFNSPGVRAYQLIKNDNSE